MTIYKIGLKEIGVQDGEAWVSLQALPSGAVAVDSYLEPRLCREDLRALRDWIDGRLGADLPCTRDNPACCGKE